MQCNRVWSPPQPFHCNGLQVSTAVLKFMAEFVLNKTQRLTFDSSSPNGILLFRQVSKVPLTLQLQQESRTAV
jgi:hypothetical protein